MKQRKMTKYIYSIQDTNENYMTEFDHVAQAINEYYEGLLGKEVLARSSIDLSIINQGPILIVEL